MKKRWIVVSAVIMIALIIASATIYLYFEKPESPKISFDLVGYTYPTITQPHACKCAFNETAAAQYIDAFVRDYNAIAQVNMSKYPITPQTSYYFPSYISSGSWEILVARDNDSAINDWIEFLFVKQIPANSPQLVFYTNESAAYLRPVTVISGKPLSGSWYIIWTPYGKGFSQYNVESPIGSSVIPLVWMANFTSVYQNTVLNAESGALALYNENVQHMNSVLNPPYPSWGWLHNSATSSIAMIFYVAGGISGIVYLYDYLTGRKLFRRRKRRRKQTARQVVKPPPKLLEPKNDRDNIDTGKHDEKSEVLSP